MKKNDSMNSKKAFTLIEILIVVSIIGLISSISVVALNSARDKASNVVVKANLSGIRQAAALFYEANGTYVGVCNTGVPNSISSYIMAALLAGNDISYAPTRNTRCHGDSNGWVAFSKLKTPEGANVYFCVDSTGKAVGMVGGTPDGNSGSYLFKPSGHNPIEDGERCP